MGYKKIIAYINAENELVSKVYAMALNYANNNVDEIFIYNYSTREEDKNSLFEIAREIDKEIDVPVFLGLNVERLEDVKKALYTGAKKVVFKEKLLKDTKLVKEAMDRFGKESVVLEIEDYTVIYNDDFAAKYASNCGGAVILKHVVMSPKLTTYLNELPISAYIRDSLVRNSVNDILELNTLGIMTNYYEKKNIIPVKRALRADGIDVNIFESTMQFSDFTTNADGLIPVVVQDYKNDEVLMVAYMNEEAFDKTMESGYMTYYSRSRKELWLKGETSGHYQFVKKVMVDCDNDTLLFKVKQLGAACHTGNRSCFYTELAAKEYDETNPTLVFNEVFDVIKDRKENPKVGSYTNYLFDKGIDKILKKCGEEATEMVIAAKNPDSEELKYEISDFLYHMMVLMVECGLDWEDITKELANRK